MRKGVHLGRPSRLHLTRWLLAHGSTGTAGIAASRRVGRSAVLLQPGRQALLLLVAQLHAAGNRLQRFLLVTLGAGERMLLEELFHLRRLFRAAEVSRTIEEDGDAA